MKEKLAMLTLALAVLASPLALAAGPAKRAARPAPTPQTAAGPKDKAIAAIDAQIAAARVNKARPDWKQHLPRPTKVEFVREHTYLWTLVTNKGTMVFKLNPDAAPMHVTNFIYLTRMGFYDGLTFHRVMRGFMAQGGDPTGSGSGGPGYSYETEVKPGVKHDHRGVLSTARLPDLNTDNCQFFIMFAPNSNLDMQYSVFGDMISGMPALDAFEAATSPGGERPTEPLVITKATVSVK